jgi:hypothetical protein
MLCVLLGRRRPGRHPAAADAGRALPPINRKGNTPCDADRGALADARGWATVGVATTKIVARLDKAGFRFA